MSPDSPLSIIISVDDEHVKDMDHVTEGLRRCGVTIVSTLAAIGVIEGACRVEDLNSVRNSEGVLSVESSRAFQLEPPNSPVQ